MIEKAIEMSNIDKYLEYKKDSLNNKNILILKQVEKFEEKYGKNCINFNVNEVAELFYSGKAIARSTLWDRVSVIKGYLRWERENNLVTAYEYAASPWNNYRYQDSLLSFKQMQEKSVYEDAFRRKYFLSAEEFLDYLFTLEKTPDQTTYESMCLYEAILCAVWVGVPTDVIPSLKLIDYDFRNRTLGGFKIYNNRINLILNYYVTKIRENRFYNDALFQGIKAPVTEKFIKSVTIKLATIRNKIPEGEQFSHCGITVIKIIRSALYERVYNRDNGFNREQLKEYITTECEKSKIDTAIKTLINEYSVYKRLKSK